MHQTRTLPWRIRVVGVLFTLCFLAIIQVFAVDPVDELQAQINETNKMLEMSVNATKPLESEVKALSTRIQSALKTISNLKEEQKQREADIAAKEKEMAGQYELFTDRVDLQYRFARTNSPLITLLTASRGTRGQQALKYTLTLAERDKHTIESIGENIIALQDAKTEAAKKVQQLSSLQAQLDKQRASFEKDIAGAKQYQTELKGKIAALSSQQQAILNARSGTFTTAVGEVPLADDFNASIGFKSQAPSNSFAVFSFGAYTHRNGMSQYGARKMADDGKSYKDIIQWYYGHGVRKDDGMENNISVQGYGEMSFQKYLYGIAEMPSNWNIEALKAQAIAARSYAKRTGKPICTTEACQVFRKDKSDNPPEAWKKAVDETEKQIIDGDVSAQYASTHGGYTNTTGWDTTNREGGGDWSTRAWESKAQSPWFYKSWYRDGYSSSGANCGRSHPWLSQTEFSDIVNAWIVRKNPNGADTNRIQPVTINDCKVGGKGGNPYSMDELRNLANGSGGAVTNVSGVSVSHNNNGQTTSVTLQTNRGEISIPGSEFKETYNLRAPGYMRVPQSGFAFFNIEKK